MPDSKPLLTEEPDNSHHNTSPEDATQPENRHHAAALVTDDSDTTMPTTTGAMGTMGDTSGAANARDTSDTTPDDTASDNPFADQPLREVYCGDTCFTLLGTAHVSRRSAEAVQYFIETGDYDAVAIELDEARYANLVNPQRWAETDLFKVFRQGKAGALAASLALSAFQQRIAAQMGIEPGAEMRAAIHAAKAKQLPLLRIDRDIGLTLRRVYHNVPWWQRMNLFAGLLLSVISHEKVDEAEIEKLKEGDMLEATFTEFAEQSSALYTPLIAERDQYMALRLLEENRRKQRRSPSAYRQVLVVIGAGHLQGLATWLEQLHQRTHERANITDTDKDTGKDTGKDTSTTNQASANSEKDIESQRMALEQSPKGIPWLKALPWLLTLLIISGFVIGFQRSPELGWRLLSDWLVVNGSLAAIGGIIATAHPLTIVGVFIAAPLTSLNPLVGAGFVAAGIELYFRKPNVGDFERLRQDVTTARGWWRNRVARTLLVFFLTTLGSAIGTYLGGFRILERLAN